jgi:uncharacterized protein (TIGR00255 family)
MAKIRSMTGVGTSRGKIGSKLYGVEVYSVNNRYLDLSVRFPSGWNGFDIPAKKLAQKYLKRGKVNVTVAPVFKENGKSATLQVDEARLKEYYQKLSHFAKKMKLAPVGLSDLLRLPQVFESSREMLEEPEWKEVEKLMISAFQTLTVSREKEGENLKKDILGRLKNLRKLHGLISAGAEDSVKSVRAKLVEKIKRLSETAGADEGRLEREVAYLAERSDISEELVRFESHLGLFEKTLEANEELGKKLDFILQELNREANTVASKAGEFSIAKHAIEIKAEIEKIREQIQNLE